MSDWPYACSRMDRPAIVEFLAGLNRSIGWKSRHIERQAGTEREKSEEILRRMKANRVILSAALTAIDNEKAAA